MSKAVSLSGKFSTEKPAIEIEGKQYPVNNGIQAVSSFQEAGQSGNLFNMLNGLKGMLGESAFEEIGVADFSVDNIQVLSTGVMAAVLGVSYDEAVARFQRGAGGSK